MDHKNKVINSLVNEAEARVKQTDAALENVALKLEGGVVYASLEGLITVVKLNSRRHGLSKAEQGIFSRVVMLLEKYLADGLNIGRLDENSQFFYSGEKIIYVGGQLDTENYDKSGARLEQGKEYTVFDNRKGLVDKTWIPVVTLEEFPGDTPEQRPGFLITMFKKKPKEEAKVIGMEAKMERTAEVVAQRCPMCGAEEIAAETPLTVYDCGSKDYDQRPNSFVQSDECKRRSTEDGPSPNIGMDSPYS